MPKIHKTFLFIAVLLLSAACYSQTEINPVFKLSGYVDAYAAYYTDSIDLNNYQKFPSVSPRSEFGLNVAQLTARYSGDKIRSTVALHYGDIPRSAWESSFNFIQEANIGIRVCKSLWIDGGFFRTHIGTEGLFPKENITSSVSVATYFEPYYEAGLRVNYTPSDKIVLNFYLLNGYNLYQDNNYKKSVGLFFTYAFTDKINIGYNNYLGDDAPQGDTTSHFKVYNNAFINFEQGKIKITAGGDVCVQQNSSIYEADKPATLYSGVFILRFMPVNPFDIYGRAEIFNDPEGFLSGIIIDEENNLSGLKLWGATLGVEYKPTDNSYIRIEGRNLNAAENQKIFYWNGENTNKRFETLFNMGVWFN